MSQPRYTPTPIARSREVEGDMVVVNMKSGNYYVLDDVSTFLWKQLEATPANVTELETALLEEYDTAAEECRVNIENFCRYMLEESLISAAT